jgi:hypothetical protein
MIKDRHFQSLPSLGSGTVSDRSSVESIAAAIKNAVEIRCATKYEQKDHCFLCLVQMNSLTLGAVPRESRTGSPVALSLETLIQLRDGWAIASFGRCDLTGQSLHSCGMPWDHFSSDFGAFWF